MTTTRENTQGRALPTPYTTIGKDTVFQGNGFNRTSLADLVTTGTPWATQLDQAVDAAALRKNDKALSLVTKGLAGLAGDVARHKGAQEIPVDESAYITVYTDLNKALKGSEVVTTREFALGVYTEAIPMLLAVNGVSARNSERGYNSNDRVVASSMALFRAEEARDQGGSFTFFSQMCAQYASGEGHSQDSFSGGLAGKLDDQKIETAFSPLLDVAAVLDRFDIPVQIVTPQLTPDPELMLAMVPATVWNYVENGRVADMILALQAHSEAFPQALAKAIEARGLSDRVTFKPISYATAENGNPSVMDRTLQICQLFGDAYNIAEQGTTNGKPWGEISAQELRRMKSSIEMFDQYYETMIHLGKNTYGWTDKDVALLQRMITTLFEEKQGTLDDTLGFYGREQERRAASASQDWRRTVDLEKEVSILLEHPELYTELHGDEREAKIRSLVQWVDTIANIDLGGRATFNTALYAALGEHVASLQSGADVGMMWPIEEDSDRWALKIMNGAFGLASEKQYPAIPCVYPAKSLRQPFAA